ncbi:MAG TPA: hypothetical protein VGP43_03880 [Chitinophagaceae bacterium]|nr:hypothetical protein [Chitinophagaceae bacterium]
MACKFKIPFTGSAEQVLNRARTAVEGQGGTFSGDEAGGEFEVSVMGTIKGSYTLIGNELDIVIDSKPMFVGCSMIEGFLKSKLVS